MRTGTSSAGRRASSVAGGYTLLEMLVALAIVAVLTATAAAALGPRSKTVELRTLATRFAADLRLAQAMARERYAPVAVRVAPSSGRWELDTTHQGALAEDISMSVSSDIADAITFFPDGSSTGGVVTFRSGTTQQRVIIDWLTGRVRESE